MKTKRIIAAAVLIVGSGLALPRTRWCIFVDAHGRIRYHQLGEGACDQAEHVMRSWTEKAYPKLIYYNKLDKGWHFAA